MVVIFIQSVFNSACFFVFTQTRVVAVITYALDTCFLFVCTNIESTYFLCGFDEI